MPDGSAESVPSSGQAELRPHAMLLTGPTAAAIAVVRLNGRPQFSNSPSPCTQEEGRGEGFSCSTIAASYLGGGPAIAPFLAAHFSRPVVAGKAVHGILRDGDRTIDDAIVVLHEGGNAVDLNVHGGPWVVRQVLDLASRSGFAIVEASQSLDAAEGATAIEREAMAAMPLASTWLGVRMLASQGRAWRRTRHRLSIQRALRDPTLRHLLYPPRLAILGSPNVGKSTLANQLFAQERSITADLPGTTRDWVGDIAVLRRLSVMLIDTPGLRVSDDPLEQRGIENSREQIGGADLRLLVMEAASPDEAMRAQFPDALVVLNKADLGPHAAVPGAIYTVATRGEGIVALRQAIERRLLRPWRHATALGVWRSHQEADLRRRLADSHSTIHLATPG